MLDPKPEQIYIGDIAFALSNLCRFTGHVKFYSVAEHSVYVSECAPTGYGLAGLLHDAAEAYIGDISKPLKMCPGMAGYNTIEHRVIGAISERFGLGLSYPADVKEVDLQMLRTEKEQLMLGETRPWDLDHVTPLDIKIQCWSPSYAYERFIKRFRELT